MVCRDVSAERAAIETLFSDLFDCANFTGRSGGMYAYEGLGSIYWHMVKLLLAVMKRSSKPRRRVHLRRQWRACGRLTTMCARVLALIRRQKFMVPARPIRIPPPGFAGAHHPGMTGQVKEEVLTRLLELGVEVADARS